MVYLGWPELNREQIRIRDFVFTYIDQLNYKFDMNNIVTLLREFVCRNGLKIFSSTSASSSGLLDIGFNDSTGNWFIQVNPTAKKVKDRVRVYLPKYVIGKGQ